MRRFIGVLSSSENLLEQPEVMEFMKKNAFGVHWMNEMLEETPEQEEETIDEE